MVEYVRDWSRDGSIVMKHPRTIQIYRSLNRGASPNPEKFGLRWFDKKPMFWPWSNCAIYTKEFEDGTILAGRLTDYNEWCKAKNNRIEKIRLFCDPQEVYFYEWNSYECMFAGDEMAYKQVVKLFGEERAKTIKRIER